MRRGRSCGARSSFCAATSAFAPTRSEQAVAHRVTLRYRDGVTAAMRLVRGLRRFAIRSAADPDGSRRELVCLVEEISP